MMLYQSHDPKNTCHNRQELLPWEKASPNLRNMTLLGQAIGRFFTLILFFPFVFTIYILSDILSM